MARYILPVASVMVALVCAAVLWSSAFAAPKDIEVRFVRLSSPEAIPAKSPTPGVFVAPVLDPALWSIFDNKSMQIFVTDALVHASDQAPFANRKPLGAPRLPARVVVPAGQMANGDVQDRRRHSTRARLDAPSIRLAAMRDPSRP